MLRLANPPARPRKYCSGSEVPIINPPCTVLLFGKEYSSDITGDGPTRKRGQQTKARQSSPQTHEFSQPPPFPHWHPIASAGLTGNAAVTNFLLQRSYVDALLPLDIWRSNLTPPQRADISRAIGTQCVPWFMQFEQFQSHVSEHLERLNIYVEASLRSHEQSIQQIAQHQSEALESINRLGGMFETLARDQHETRKKVSSLENSVKELTDRVQVLEGLVSSPADVTSWKTQHGARPCRGRSPAKPELPELMEPESVRSLSIPERLRHAQSRAASIRRTGQAFIYNSGASSSNAPVPAFNAPQVHTMSEPFVSSSANIESTFPTEEDNIANTPSPRLSPQMQPLVMLVPAFNDGEIDQAKLLEGLIEPTASTPMPPPGLPLEAVQRPEAGELFEADPEDGVPG